MASARAWRRVRRMLGAVNSLAVMGGLPFMEDLYEAAFLGRVLGERADLFEIVEFFEIPDIGQIREIRTAVIDLALARLKVKAAD